MLLKIHLLQRQSAEKWHWGDGNSLRMRCLSKLPVWGRLDMMLMLSPLSQRSLRLRSGLLPRGYSEDKNQLTQVVIAVYPIKKALN